MTEVTEELSSLTPPATRRPDRRALRRAGMNEAASETATRRIVTRRASSGLAASRRIADCSGFPTRPRHQPVPSGRRSRPRRGSGARLGVHDGNAIWRIRHKAVRARDERDAQLLITQRSDLQRPGACRYKCQSLSPLVAQSAVPLLEAPRARSEQTDDDEHYRTANLWNSLNINLLVGSRGFDHARQRWWQALWFFCETPSSIVYSGRV